MKNETIFNILGRLSISVGQNERSRELIDILFDQLQNLLSTSDRPEEMLLGDSYEIETREEHVYGEVLEQELMEMEEMQNVI